MGVNSQIEITPGSGQKKIATISYQEDGITKEIQKVIYTNDEGQIIGTLSLPMYMALASAIKGENGALNRMMTGSFCKGSRITGSNQIKPAMGFVHQFTIDAITVAGVLTIYDNVSASGTILFQGRLEVTDVLKPVLIDKIAENGIFFSFDGTLAAALGVSWI